MGHIERGGGLKQNPKRSFVDRAMCENLSRFLLSKGDLIMSMTDMKSSMALLGHTAMIDRDETYILNQRVGRITVHDSTRLDQVFFYYYSNSPWYIQYLRGVAHSGVQVNLSTDEIKKSPVALPPIPTQRRIASILSTYDDLIENNTRRIAILEEMARRLYEEWFAHFRFPGNQSEGQVPDNWKEGTLKDVVTLQRGFDLPKKHRKEGEIPVFAATGQHGTHNEEKVRGPRIVTGRSGSLGSVSYVHNDFWPLNTTLWGKEFALGSVLYAFFFLSAVDLKGFNSGAAVPTLNRNDLHGLPTRLPPVDLLLEFDAQVQPLFDLKFNLERKNANLRAQRDLLLPKLVTGEIDVSEAEEPLEDAVA